MRTLPRPQPDLFVETTRFAELTGAQRQKALALLQALLMEASLPRASEPSAAVKETGDE